VSLEQPEPNLDPYRAPRATESVTPLPEEREGSFAARVSIVLAISGFVLFWGVTALVRILPWQYKPTGLALSWALFISVTLHLVGLGVVFAAPRGRRFVGLMANAVALLALVGLIAAVHMN
jgi:hypothetical protein